MCAVVFQTCSDAQSAGRLSFMPLRGIGSRFHALVHSHDCTRNPNVLRKQPFPSYLADSLNFRLDKALAPVPF